ncbi:MAG TPA: hypothetical protein VHL98_04670 [Microvirga sp.]|jgi:hypothetical protein|nr:hypothetical protein [Microvirga sp.]
MAVNPTVTCIPTGRDDVAPPATPAAAGAGAGGRDGGDAPMLDRRILARLGRHLAELYRDLEPVPAPARLRDLAGTLDERIRTAART